MAAPGGSHELLPSSRIRLGIGLLVALGGIWGTSGWADEVRTGRKLVDQGRALFAREWLPDDARCHGGDGLGPVFNDTSCVACHNLGAPGGAGPVNKNAEIVSAFAKSELGGGEMGAPSGLRQRVGRQFRRGGSTDDTAKREDKSASPSKPNIEELAKLHPGFRSARSVVLHRFGTDPHYQLWRARLLGQNLQDEGQAGTTRIDQAKQAIARLQAQAVADTEVVRSTQADHGDFVLLASQRNTPPLFGTGLIDAIPDAVLEAAARKTDPAFPEVQGRVSRLRDGRIGRFGWKGQTASLKDFVLTACAVELGLENPGQPQAGPPTAPHYQSAGPDMEAPECDALVAYVRDLPAPSRREPSSDQEARTIKAGREAFAKVGCASCHSPTLGSVEGIYSDLLLHDMGPSLGDSGSYSVTVPNSADLADDTLPAQGNLASAAKTAKSPDDKAKPRFGAGCNRNGGRLPCGASATPGRISTTAGPRPWNKASPCTAARAADRPNNSSCCRPENDSRSRRSSSRSPRQSRSPRPGIEDRSALDRDHQGGTDERLSSPAPCARADPAREPGSPGSERRRPGG